MTRFRLPTTALLVSVLVVACGGSDPSTDGGVEGPSPVSGDVAWADQCTTEAPVDLPTDFYICVDSGFRPESSGFSFENWAGPVAEDAVTVSTAVAMFGEEATCARLEGDVCVPYPAVDQWIEEMNLPLAAS